MMKQFIFPVLKAEPEYPERVVVDLLFAMGGNDFTLEQVTGRSGDARIDESDPLPNPDVGELI